MILSLERVLRFVTVAEQLSFTRAAAQLRIDQPWLSRQIMQLEAQLGFPLFERGNSRINLTPQGVEFFAMAKELAEVAERTQQKAEDMRRRALSVLRIGASYPIAPVEWRERLLDKFASVRPRINIEYSVYEWSDDVIQRVNTDDLDFGIAFGPILEPNLEACILEAVDATIAVPSEDPLAQASSIRLTDLKDRRIAVGLSSANSSRFRIAYSWIDKVGAIPVFVPEGRRFIFDVAAKERLVVLCYGSIDRPPEDFTMSPLRGPHPRFDICLIRRKRAMSQIGERLWRVGLDWSTEQDEDGKTVVA